jgi:phosphate transport system permease protein
MLSRYQRRLLVNRFNLAMSLATMVLGMLFLFWILAVLFANGAEALSPTLFTQSTPPPGSAGGLKNALYGSLLIVGTATLVSTPRISTSQPRPSPVAPTINAEAMKFRRRRLR